MAAFFFFLIWSVLLIQCFYFSADHLPLEREVGILPLNSGTIVVLTLFSVTCILYIVVWGCGFCFGKKIISS